MTAPRGNHEDSHVNQLLNALAAFIDSLIIPVAAIPMGQVLRVDVAGDDGTALPGRLDRPYRHIANAIAAANVAGGDTILIGAGTFNETLVIPDTMVSLDIVGAGMYETVITPVGAADCITWTGNATDLARLGIRDLSITAAAGRALVINADAQTTSFDDVLSGLNGLILDHVYMSSSGAAAFTFTAVNFVRMFNCTTNDANTLAFTHCSLVVLRDCVLGALTFSYTDAGNKPSRNLRPKNLDSCRFASLTQTAIDQVVCDADCISVGNITTTILDSALGFGSGSLEFHGNCLGNMVLSHNLTLAPRTAFFCDRCKLLGTLDPAGIGLVGTVNFRNAVLYTVAAGGITVGANTALDLIGAEFTNTIAVLVSLGATGTCNRSYFSTPLTTGAGIVAYTFAADPGGAACPFTDALFNVSVETTVAGEDPLITAKAATGFTTTMVTGATATFTVLHQ